MRGKPARCWSVALPALIVIVVYLPTLWHDFVWDDTIFLRDVPLYRTPGLVGQALTRPFILSPNYFRPLGLLPFMGELRLVGLHPALFHLTNLLLHALNTTLVVLLAREVWCAPPGRRDLGRFGWLAPLGVGLLYGLHPALVEGVAFVSSRFDLLTTTFLLLALLAVAELKHPVGQPVSVGLAFLLAALSKEMAVALVFVLPLWRLALRSTPLLPHPFKQVWQILRQPQTVVSMGALAVAGCAYLGLRYAALGYLWLPAAARSLDAGTPLQHVLLVGRSLAAYVLLVVWPFTSLAPIHYAALPVSAADPVAWAGMGIGVLVVVLLVLWLRRAPRSGWLVLAGLLALLPVLNVLPLELGGGAFVAERFLVFPMALFCLAAAPLVSAALMHVEGGDGRLEMVARLGVAAWLVGSGVTVALTLPRWRDDMALWTWAAARAPQSPTPPTNLALQHIERGDYETGLEATERAIALEPKHADAWSNAGLAHIHLGRFPEAQAAFEQAVALAPQSALYWNNLAAALRELGALQEAERILLDQVLVLDPALPVARVNLGYVYLRADRPDLAAVHLAEAVRLLPPDEVQEAESLLVRTEEPDRWLRLGDLLLAHGDPDGALGVFAQAGALGAGAADVAAGQSAVLIELREWQQAEAVLLAAQEEWPDDARLANNLGVVARERGDLTQARGYFEQAAALAPEWELPRQNLAELVS